MRDLDAIINALPVPRSGAKRRVDGAGHWLVQLLAHAHHALVLHHVQVRDARLPARVRLHLGPGEVRICHFLSLVTCNVVVLAHTRIAACCSSAGHIPWPLETLAGGIAHRSPGRKRTMPDDHSRMQTELGSGGRGG